MGVAGRGRSLGRGAWAIRYGFRAAGFIWIGGSLGFRFWRVFAREFFRDFSRKCRKAICVGVRG